MAVYIDNISVGLQEDQQLCYFRALDRLGLPASRVREYHIVRRALDARKKDDIRFVYTIAFEITGEEQLKLRPGMRLHREQPLNVYPGNRTLPVRPVIAGFGPAGMFCGLLLAQHGYRPLILERGQDVTLRQAAVERFWRDGILDEQSNVQFGEGGAGTFSDGKLTTRINDPRCSFVLRQFVRMGAPEEILYTAKPHLGTDMLAGIIQNIRREILALGGEIFFETQLTGLVTRGGKLSGVWAGNRELPVEALVLAIGHSSRDTLRMLWQNGIAMEVKPFSVGVRIEHLQEEIDRGLYGAMAGHPLLPKGEYQLSHRNEQGEAVYTFCMCPGGTVLPAASQEHTVVTNGMSRYRRDGVNANAALVVSVDSKDFGEDPMKAIAWQSALEQRGWQLTGSYRAPIQSAGLFLEGKSGCSFGRILPSYALGVQEVCFDDLFSARITENLRRGLRLFGRKLPGFDASDALLTGPETRTSSPVRILRGEDLQSLSLKGIYPCGEGAGYAGGIMSAAVDGLRVAQEIINNYKPFD